MNHTESTSSYRYGRALIALAAGLVLSILFRGPSTTPLPLLAAVAYGAWYGGTGPGVLLTLISSTLISLLYARAGLLPAQLVTPVLFLGMALALVWAFTSEERRSAAAGRNTDENGVASAGSGTPPQAEGEIERGSRSAFLAEAGEILAGSLDYEETLARVAQLAVPHIADWCSVAIVQEDGGFQTLAVTHVDPAKVVWARELQRRFPADPNSPNGVPKVIRTGRAEFVPLITDEMLVAAARSPEELEIVRSVGFTSVMIVPLIARGRTLGAITFVTAESGKQFDQADLALAQDLARLAALAVDNARNHAEAGAQREWFEVTLGSIGDAVIATDSNGRITFMNPVAQELTGWPLAEARERELSEIFRIINETSLQPVENPVDRVLREGTIVGLANHTLLVDRNGGHRPIDDSAAPIRGRDGAINGVVLVFHDVADRRRAEAELQQSRDQLDIILGGVADGITVQDATGRLVFANEEGSRFIGFPDSAALLAASPDEVMSRFDLRDEENNPLPIENLPGRRALRGETNSSAIIRAHNAVTGTERWSIVRANPVLDDQGRVVFAVNIFHDVTEQKLAEEELRRRFDQLQNIYHLSEAAARAEGPEEIDAAALESIGRMLGADRSAILISDEHGRMRFRSWKNLSERYRSAVEGHSPWEPDEKHPMPVLVPDVATDPSLDALRQTIAEEKIAALCFIPLVYGGRLLGKFMIYFDQPHPFTDEEVQMAQTVAHHVAFALGRRSDSDALRFQADLLNAVEQAVIATDMRGTVTYWNRFAEQLYGWSSREAVGRNITELTVPPEIASAAGEIMKQVARGSSWSGEFLVRQRNGTIFPSLTTLSAIHAHNGELIGIVGISLDLSESKAINSQLAEETETLEIVNRIGQVLSAELDLSKLVQAVTDAATEISGAMFGSFFYNVVEANQESYMLYSLSGVPKEHFEQFPMPRSTEIFAPTFHGAGNVRVDDVRQDPRYGKNSPHFGIPPGHLPVVSYLAVPVVSRSGVVIGGLFFGHPEPGVFTERAERIVTGLAAQAAIAIDNARLYNAAQQEIEERRRTAEELKRAMEQAEAANKAKDQFLAVLSHELRTPLTPVLTAVYAMETEESLSPALQPYIEIIRRNVDLEARLIDDLLDLTRISKGKLQLAVETVDAHALMRYVLEICHAEIAAKQLALEVDLSAPRHFLSGDPARLQQVYWNLVKNAVKFTPNRGRIAIRSFNDDAGELVIQVEDNGIGIEPDVLPRIFNAFEQGEQTITRRYGGLGLGLAISKALVDMHGGSLAAASPGREMGATFTVRLANVEPVGSLNGTNGVAMATDEAPTALRILIVDDHEDTSRVMKILLERRGYQVFTASDVRSALAVAAAQPFDLLISDIGLPDGSGVDLMRKLHEERPVKGIALSGFGMEQDVRRSKEAGFAEHLTKPVSFQRLHEVIQQIIA